MGLLGFIALPFGVAENDRSNDRLARALAEGVLASAEAPGVVVVEGDTTIHALWYVQSVEKRGANLVVLNVPAGSPLT